MIFARGIPLLFVKNFPEKCDFSKLLYCNFEIKRVYYITDTQRDVVRGHHAHKNLKQVLICVHGSCRIGLDDGTEKTEVLLDKINEGLYIESNMWRTMYDFSEGAVLLVLASELYDEADYIRNYDKFIEYVKGV